MELEKFNDEVFFIKDDVIKLDNKNIEFLKEQIKNSVNKRVRLCAHKNSDESLHEMMIMIDKDSYIQPHKHDGKSESFHIIEGELDVILFDDDGEIKEIVQMGPVGFGKKFFYRISKPYFHTPIIKTNFVIFHETTNGPFEKGKTKYPNWAPDENDKAAGKKYLNKLREMIR